MTDTHLKEAALELAAQCWCDPETQNRVMDTALAEAFAKRLVELIRLRAYLHSKRLHPDYEYETTTGGRKCFDEHAPEGEGWERNREEGRNGWERFDYHEEAYWRRLKQP